MYIVQFTFLNESLLVFLKECVLPVRAAGRIWRLRLEKDRLESLQHCNTVCENAIGQQKSVQKVNVQEAKISQPLQEPLGGCVTNLRNL